MYKKQQQEQHITKHTTKKINGHLTQLGAPLPAPTMAAPPPPGTRLPRALDEETEQQRAQATARPSPGSNPGEPAPARSVAAPEPTRSSAAARAGNAAAARHRADGGGVIG